MSPATVKFRHYSSPPVIGTGKLRTDDSKPRYIQPNEFCPSVPETWPSGPHDEPDAEYCIRLLDTNAGEFLKKFGAFSEVWVALPQDAGFDLWAAGEIFRSLIEDPADSYWRQVLGEYVTAEIGHRQVLCPLSRRLRSVFAAAVRRRADDFLKPSAGQVPALFADFRKNVVKSRLHPCHDVVVIGPAWQAEIDLLRRDRAAWRRDMEGATRFCVLVESCDRTEPLICEGTWVTNPQSILFTERAWADREYSLEKRGFGLVAITDRSEITRFALPAGYSFPAVAGASWCVKARLEDSRYGYWRVSADTHVSQSMIKQFIHEKLEGPIFADGLKWCREKNEIRPAVAPLSEEGHYWFRTFKLHSGLGTTLNAAVVQTIGQALWTQVRPKADTSVMPPDFAQKHRQGSSGIISVWSRQGLAVAYTEDGEPIAENLCCLIEKLNQAHDIAEKLNNPDSKSSDDRLTLYKGLLELDAKLKIETETPGGRLLRGLFATFNAGAVHAAEYERQMLRLQNEAQEKLEFIELFVVGFYTFEFARAAVEAPEPGHVARNAAGLVIAFVMAVFIYYRLHKTLMPDTGGKDISRPNPRPGISKLRRMQKFKLLVFVVSLSVILLGIGWDAFSDWPKDQGKEVGTAQVASPSPEAIHSQRPAPEVQAPLEIVTPPDAGTGPKGKKAPSGASGLRGASADTGGNSRKNGK